MGQRVATWQQQEAQVLEQFVGLQCPGFVGRREIIEQLLKVALSPDEVNATWGICLIGSSGAGAPLQQMCLES